MEWPFTPTGIYNMQKEAGYDDEDGNEIIFSERFHCRHDGMPIPAIVTYKAKVEFKPWMGKIFRVIIMLGFGLADEERANGTAVFHSDLKAEAPARPPPRNRQRPVFCRALACSARNLVRAVLRGM